MSGYVASVVIPVIGDTANDLDIRSTASAPGYGGTSPYEFRSSHVVHNYPRIAGEVPGVLIA